MAKVLARDTFIDHKNALWIRLTSPVDISSLVFFRISFGVLLVWEMWRYWSSGAIEGMYIAPPFHFTYYGLSWITPWAGSGMYAHFLGLGVLAGFIMVGFYYRLSALLFFLGFTYLFLIDKAYYLNHFYLISLISFLLILAPAHRAYSIDVARRPGDRSDTVSAWVVWLLRAQIGIVYFYGGIAKFEHDWLRGESMGTMLARRTDFPVIGPWMATEGMAYLFSYAGLFLDLLAVPFLLWSRTRPIAFALLVAFHLVNSQLWSIGIFPWFMIAATLLFFSPDWPRRLIRAVKREKVQSRTSRRRARDQRLALPSSTLSRLNYAFVLLIAVFLFVQVSVPFRHFLYPGNTAWTEEGTRFSWRMMLRTKTGSTQFVVFAVKDESFSSVPSIIEPITFLSNYQTRVMSKFPDMTLQAAHYLAEDLRNQGYSQIEIRARTGVSLNGRLPQMLIDPEIDLVPEKGGLKPASWILPLNEGLP